jgi:hypothetical protein
MTAAHAPAQHSSATSTTTASLAAAALSEYTSTAAATTSSEAAGTSAGAGTRTAAGTGTSTATGTSTGTDVPEVRWTSPEAKLWVATRGADFAGFVEFREGHYVVTDGRGAQLDDCATLREAKALITRADEPAKLPAALTYIAVVTGGVAVTVFGAGLAVLWMG